MRIVRNIFLVVLALFSLLLVNTIVLAQTQNETAKENVKKTTEYSLPYPGILPDHPFYSLKMIRDKMIEFLTIDPLKKAEFYLLAADKRLAASQTLSDKQKFALAQTTLSKSEKYLLKSLEKTLEAKDRGKDTTGFIDRLKRAVAKHEEVIAVFLTRFPEEFKPGLESSQEINKQVENKISQLMETGGSPTPTPEATESGQTSY